ncbi:MAG TPA: hypothetical protein VLF18_18970 [Tahibacter sp.]|uniref:hypothetical protein n=1 Tax=Tahibacter sp. TaxID=2056211 RepID=UPI002CEC8939|nr:hypothetical protein [Tahibacter sp.]HSX62271.1 hypothetical protein [Tahibacter sp.]
MDVQTKKRLQLIAIMFVFLAPMIVAFALRLGDWQPNRLRNNGILVKPPQELAADTPRATRDAAFGWKDAQYRWTLVLIAGPDCAAACEQRLADAEKIWSLMTQKATRLRLAAVGVEATPVRLEKYPRIEFVASSAAPLQALKPAAADTVAAAVVDPAGLLMLRFEPGYDPAGVRQDLSRLIR